ncbi:MAG: hypothetical protein GF311_05820 [Candidatus Lokiarchaeota archaeon]|nr:hypothetical protein [Candidatus Lokiarchaeota archaeon]
MSQNLGNLNINWKKLANKGKETEKVERIIKTFAQQQEDIINGFIGQSSNNCLFNEKLTNLSYEFEEYLELRLNNLISENNQKHNEDLLKKRFDIYKLELFKYLNNKINRCIFSEITFKQGYYLYKLFEALAKTNSEVIFKINPKNIEIYSSNDSQTFLIRILLKVKDNHYIYYNPLVLLVNLKNVVQALKCKKTDRTSTNLIIKKDKVIINLHSRIFMSKIRRVIENLEVLTQENKILKDLMGHKHSGVFILDKNKFLHLLSQSQRYSEVLNLELTKEEVIFSESNQFNKSIINWDKNLIKKLELENNSIITSFSIEHLKVIANFLFESNPNLEFYLEENLPLKIRTNFKTLEDSFGIIFIAIRN